MEIRRLGQSDLYIAPLAFGGNVFGWTINEKQSFTILDQFVASGFNFIDTADVYSRWASGVGGESETIIGNWMKKKGNRRSIVLATKVGMEMGEGKKGLSKKYIIKAVEDSLKRLQTDHIDLYQSHKDDEVTPMEDTLQAYQQLIKEGKVRYIGASNFSAERFAKALEISKKYDLPRYECLQPHYNLCERSGFENGLEKICQENQVGVISYYSLAAGFLTGKYRSEKDLGKSVRGKGAAKYLTPKGEKILKALDEVAANHRVKPATIALAWIMSRRVITAPITSATTSEQLAELTASTSINLRIEEKELLDEASAG
jgi:aryl-alcohol dehydrogenase-like predicted oxidoreductase